MSRVRVHNFSISLDGFATGEPQSLEAPFGHAGERLHGWMIRTRFWSEQGSDGLDAFAQQHSQGIGAEIMGANKFGPPGWHEDPEWRGWWGPNPPFHTPVFVLTHHVRPPLEMEGGNVFHFVDASPDEGLAMASEAAGDLDVRIGGGATVSASSSLRVWSTTCTSSRCPSSWAGECVSGTGWRAWRTDTGSSSCRHPAG